MAELSAGKDLLAALLRPLPQKGPVQFSSKKLTGMVLKVGVLLHILQAQTKC